MWHGIGCAGGLALPFYSPRAQGAKRFHSTVRETPGGGGGGNKKKKKKLTPPPPLLFFFLGGGPPPPPPAGPLSPFFFFGGRDPPPPPRPSGARERVEIFKETLAQVAVLCNRNKEDMQELDFLLLDMDKGPEDVYVRPTENWGLYYVIFCICIYIYISFSNLGSRNNYDSGYIP